MPQGFSLDVRGIGLSDTCPPAKCGVVPRRFWRPARGAASWQVVEKEKTRIVPDKTQREQFR